MGRMGSGYGSEYHLQHYLNDYPEVLGARAADVASIAGQVVWLPRTAAVTRPVKLVEWKSLDFIVDPELQRAWRAFWPQGRGIQNWDAVGHAGSNPREEWILVEAKAHVAALLSHCAATRPAIREQIALALEETKRALGVPVECAWLQPYYQYCNRIAVVWFLHQHGVKVHLLSLYFIGDASSGGRRCPQAADEWQEPLERQRRHIGLPEEHPLANHLHTLILHANPRVSNMGSSQRPSTAVAAIVGQ